jgi:DNA repair protein RadC
MLEPMTPLPVPRDAIAAELHRRGQPDGALLAVFLDDRHRIVLWVEISEGTHDVDELFLRHLVTIVGDLGLAAVAFGVTRVSGRPRRVDRLLWRELDHRLAGSATRLLDVIVVGADRQWSAARGRAQPVTGPT